MFPAPSPMGNEPPLYTKGVPIIWIRLHTYVRLIVGQPDNDSRNTHATKEYNLPLTLHLYAALQTVRRLIAQRIKPRPSSIGSAAVASTPRADTAAEKSTQTNLRALLVYLTLLLGRIDHDMITLYPSEIF
jgi:hypothetical protein